MNDGAQTADETLAPPIGASVWERELFDHLVTHVEREREILQDYTWAAGLTNSQAFKYVVELLVQDERRHHALFESLAASLKADAELRGADAPIPRMDFHRSDAVRVRELTLNLLKNEEEDTKDLRRLHNELLDVKDTTLWDLMVSLMRRDTDKHIAMLEFVLKHTPPQTLRWRGWRG